MRNNLIVKASLFTLILAFIAIGTFAIAKEVIKKEKPVKATTVVPTEPWYFNATEDSNPKNPKNYGRQPVNPNQCQAPFETVCEINAPADGDQPDMTATIGTKTVEEHIQDALDALPSEDPPANPVVSEYKPL